MRSKLLTFRVTFERSDRVERVRAEAYRSVPPNVEFVVTEGEGMNIRNRVVATFDGRQIARISTTGWPAQVPREPPRLCAAICPAAPEKGFCRPPRSVGRRCGSNRQWCAGSPNRSRAACLVTPRTAAI